MRVTKEADYALRIMWYLSGVLKNNADKKIIDAGTMSDSLCIPPRFTLKILRKLTKEGFIKSYKGMNGGYTLAGLPDKITMRKIIESVDGPVEISRCLNDEYECTRVGNQKDDCAYHRVFEDINKKITAEFDKITFDMLLDKN